MNKTFVLLGLIICIPLVSAASLHDAWHHAEDTFTVADAEYYVFHEYNENSILLTMDNRSTLISLGECKELLGRMHCFTEINRNFSSDKVDFRDGKPYAGLKISINSVGPQMSLSRSASETNIELDEIARITVKISNKGNRQVDSFVYYDKFPSSLRMIDSNMRGNAFLRKGTLGPGQSITFSYNVKALEFTTYSSKAVLNHTYQGETETINSNAINFVVQSPYEVTTSIDDKKLLLGEGFVYEIKLKNPSEDEIQVKEFEIKYPRMKLVNFDRNLTKESGSLSWQGYLDEGEERTFKATILPSRTGDYSVNVEAVFNHWGKNYDFTKEDSLVVEVEGADAELYISPKEVTSGSEVKISGRIRNNDEFDYRLADASLEIFGKKLNVDVDRVKAGSSDVVVEDILIAPEVFEKKIYPVTFSGKYLHPEGDIFFFSVSDSVNVSPRSNIMNISIDTPSEIYAGDLGKVTVKIHNLMEQATRFSVRDELIPAFKIEKGKNSGVVDVSAGGVEEVYYYEFRIPYNTKRGEVVVKTNAKISGTNVSTQKSVVIPISKQEANQTVAEEEVVQEPGFFTRVIDGISSFFSKWFG